MLTKTWSFLTAGLCLLAASLISSKQLTHSSLDKRFLREQCFRDFNTNEQCQIANVAFFSDDDCSQPMVLDRQIPGSTKSNHFVRGNAKLLFDGAISATPAGFRSIKILGATEGYGVGFAQRPDSDTLVMNMAWLSAANTRYAMHTQSCLQLGNVYAPLANYWTVKAEGVLNQPGYVWNPHNLPLKKNAAECITRRKGKTLSVCLERRSWGAGGEFELYKTADCTGAATRQMFNTAQCEPLSTTQFASFKAIQPLGDTVTFSFSHEYYGIGQNSYHACGHDGIVTRPFTPGKCQKLAADGEFVGIFGNDDEFPQEGPDAGAVPIRKGTSRSHSVDSPKSP